MSIGFESLNLDRIPPNGVGLKLFKPSPSGKGITACETVQFVDGAAAINTILRRAYLSGHVVVDPAAPLPDYFADIMDSSGEMVGHVALDRESYKALKNHWMRCKIESSDA